MLTLVTDISFGLKVSKGHKGMTIRRRQSDNLQGLNWSDLDVSQFQKLKAKDLHRQ